MTPSTILVQELFHAVTDPDLLGALDPEQRQVAEALRGPVRVLAGAGTGKTRAITHRIAHGVAQGLYAPTEVLAVTFTTRAAGEMRGRLHRLGAPGVQARTFHSAALRQLRWFWPTTYGGELPTLTESKLALVAAAARRLRVHTDQALLRDLASEIEWAKVSNVGPDDYAAVALARGREVGQLDLETVGRLFGGYEETKRSQSRMDMEDVLLLTAGMLAEEERVAAQVRAQYKWFVVDEFQDVSPIQSALLDLWLGGRDEICVVGDPAQTIYSFAGANADYLRDFPRKFPGTTSVELSRNYRSTPEVVEAANTVLAGSASTSVRLRAQRPAGPPVRYLPTADEVAEADAVAEAVGRLVADGVPTSEIAVLFRINAQSEAFEEALASRGVPYVVRGAARFFERGEVRQAVTLIRGAAHTDGGATPVADLVRAALGGMGWTPEAPAARGQTRDRWESLQALVAMAEESADLTSRGVRRRPRATRLRAARTRRRRRDPLDAPRRQGAGVGRRVPGRHARRRDAALPRHDPGRDRGGAPPPLRRHDPGPGPSHGLLGRGPDAGWARQPPALPVPRPAAPRRGPRPERSPQGPACRALPRVRQAAVVRRREEARPLRRLPRVVRRGALRAPARVAQGAGRRGRGAGVRGLHRRHAAADRRAAADLRGGPAADQRCGSGEARALRRLASRGRRVGP